jgi:hypothetical protein
MQFALPEHLKVAVAAYDPTLKVLAREQAKASKPRKQSFSLGLPDDLVPADLMPAARQVQVAKDFHGVAAENRVHIFRLKEEQVIVCIMHHRSVWMAAWVDLRQSDYLYGFTYEYKTAPSVSQKVDPIVVKGGYSHRLELREQEKTVKHGRVEFFRYSATITQEQIKSGAEVLPWDSLVDRWHKSTTNKWRVWNNFTKLAIEPRVITFSDSHVFARLKAIGNPSQFLFGNYGESREVTPAEILKSALIPDRVADTPFFRNEVLTAATTFNARLNDPEIREAKDVKSPVKHFMHRIQWVRRFLEIYPDAQLDYVQQIYDVCSNIEMPWSLRHERPIKWLRDNMPIASFIRVCRTFADGVQEHLSGLLPEQREREINSRTRFGDGFPVWHFNNLNDTLSMLDNVLCAMAKNPETEVKLERPDRWRISDFHDYLVGLSFKIENTNDPLPQHLFPQPIKVNDATGQKWSFFQPSDVHQLASWGQAVRNCVGSASSYREGIKRKTHFIVLAMVQNKPQFTIQLRVDNGVMSVVQIAGIGNRSLTDIERKTYETVFGEALNKQNQILAGEVA